MYADADNSDNANSGLGNVGDVAERRRRWRAPAHSYSRRGGSYFWREEDSCTSYSCFGKPWDGEETFFRLASDDRSDVMGDPGIVNMRKPS